MPMLPYDTAAGIKEKGYTIYSLGFFHSLSGTNLDFGRLFMSDLASDGCYYEVTNADDLEFVSWRNCGRNNSFPLMNSVLPVISSKMT